MYGEGDMKFVVSSILSHQNKNNHFKVSYFISQRQLKYTSIKVVQEYIDLKLADSQSPRLILKKSRLLCNLVNWKRYELVPNDIYIRTENNQRSLFLFSLLPEIKYIILIDLIKSVLRINRIKFARVFYKLIFNLQNGWDTSYIKS